ncbi:MAG: UvrD-helicase domain-containing protein [Acidimicrobiales bacterium]
MTATRPPTDHADRLRIEQTGLHETLFVEAGAGTGKTHELVERILHLVVDAGIPLSAIAAITFTEAAAAELRDRVRERLERRLADGPPEAERAACQQALDDIDEAAISTLHGFALRILSEQPLGVGLPPRVEILDEVSSQLAFQDRWRRFVDELYADPDAEELVVRAWALGIEVDSPRRISTLKHVAEVFEDSWDRLDAVADTAHPPLPPIDLRPLELAATALGAVPADCNNSADKLLDRIAEARTEVAEVLAADDPVRCLELVATHKKGWKASGSGAKPNWGDVVAARAALDAVGAAGDVVVERVTDDVLRRLATRIARFTRDAAEARRAEGRLDFHDLLVLARRLVRTNAGARAALHERYQRLLLDEFQDTDPIQIEVAVLIAATVQGGTVEGGTVDRPWSKVATEPGRLFFVGDPKQSIYRFRRADIGLYLDARDAFGGTTSVPLRQNFRTVEPVLDWVNHVFGELMPDEVPRAQPRYQPLEAFRTDLPGDHPADHRVVLLGGERELKAGELRDEEARAVADAIVSIRDDGDAWRVQDERTKQWRAPCMADVTILVPTRTSLRQLEDALDGEGIPYRVATGTLVYDTQEVREVLDALRAIDDPGDAIALVSALRSPLYACSDVDLFTYHEAGGHWDLRRTPPAALAGDHPVVAAVAHLRSLWDIRWWHEPSALLERLLRERQAFALAFAQRRPREVWRRLRFVVDQARAFEEAGGGGLRPFLAWAELQRNEGSRVHEPMLAETDDDAVTILTIHGSKGLEFPITILSGASTQFGSGRKGVQVLWEGDVPELKLRANASTEHFARLADIEAEMDVHERARLLYVACTRARDHLVVSTFHAGTKPTYGQWLQVHSGDEADGRWKRLPDRLPVVAPRPPAPPPPPAPDDRDGWVAARTRLLAERGRPRFASATAIAREAAEPVEPAGDGGGPGIPWSKGRAGTAIGRAVHATLQLHDGDPVTIDRLATQHAHLEAVPEAAATVAAQARSALRAPTVVAAHAAARSWRELYVAAPVGDRAVEGYIDLLYETPEGLVLVDYKTDSVTGPADADAKTARYGLQTATYALALEASTGLEVVAAHLVFCTAGEPLERQVPDLPGLKEQVRRLVSGPDPVPPRRPDRRSG